MLPYIGATGFMTSKEARRIVNFFNAHRPPESNRQLHIGTMMSYKTLHNISTEWATVFPRKEGVASIFCSEDTMNCLHYADYQHLDCEKDLLSAIEYGGIGITALQLDMTWPDPTQVANAVHISRRQLDVILQIGRHAFEEAGNDPQGVVERLWDYQTVIRYVLLDKSMGKGLELDVTGLLPFMRAIKENFPELGLVVAGGLGPNTVNLVQPLLEEFPDLSFDAQGKLQQGGDRLAPLDMDATEAYLLQALELTQ